MIANTTVSHTSVMYKPAPEMNRMKYATKYATEITDDEWHGVARPEWLRFFDCRSDETAPFPKAIWGETLYGGETAHVDLGLKRGYGDNDATTLISCNTYIDSRSCNTSELTRQITNMVREAVRFRQEYQEHQGDVTKPDQGGSCLYLPVAAELSNFGWSVIADRRSRIVVSFRSYATQS